MNKYSKNKNTESIIFIDRLQLLDSDCDILLQSSLGNQLKKRFCLNSNIMKYSRV